MSRRGSQLKRLWQVLALAVLCAVAFAGVDSMRLAWARAHQPTGSAEWIWGRQMEAPVAYFLVKDFEIVGQIRASELQILADETYTAYLNGERVGSNRYRAHAPVDRYSVTRYLRSGANRIAVQVELTRLRGGLLARIVDFDAGGQPRELVASDDTWSVLPESAGSRFSDPSFRLRPLPRSRSLGRSPRGRWGGLRLGAHRSVLQDHLLTARGGEFAPPSRARSVRIDGGVAMRLGSGARNRSLGNWVEFSWDRPQTGYFGIRYRADEPPVGLVYFGLEPPNPMSRAPDLILVGVERRPTWEDSVVRRFRYALVLGVPSVVDGQVHRVQPGKVEVWGTDGVGVLGLTPPPAGTRLRSAVEDEVWRRLQGLPGSAGG